MIKLDYFFESLNHDSRDSRIYIYIHILLYCKTLCNVLMFDVHVFSVWGRCRSWSLCITWWNPISQCLSCGFVWKQRKTPFHSWWIYSLSSFSWCSVGLNHQFRHRNSHCCILHLSSIVRLAPAWLPYSWPARAQVDGHPCRKHFGGRAGTCFGASRDDRNCKNPSKSKDLEASCWSIIWVGFFSDHLLLGPFGISWWSLFWPFFLLGPNHSFCSQKWYIFAWFQDIKAPPRKDTLKFRPKWCGVRKGVPFAADISSSIFRSKNGKHKPTWKSARARCTSGWKSNDRNPATMMGLGQSLWKNLISGWFANSFGIFWATNFPIW